ncbi:unnamed protein product [Dicrocoelium dendriticum]|nr:unnamed protein product [Dicrocoelium dendriticum]
MDSPEPLYYVWTEYVLSARPSELATLLDNPRVRTATSKTRCNLEVTRRVLNRRMYDQWARYSIVRITGPDDQSINQCNRMLERAIPLYQQRIEYSRRAPVTLYSKNVEAEGDFRSRVGHLALSSGKKRPSSEGRSISTKNDRNIDSPFVQTGSFILDMSGHVQVSYDDPTSLRSGGSHAKLDAKFSTRSAVTTSSHSDEQLGAPSPKAISVINSAMNTSVIQDDGKASLSFAISAKSGDSLEVNAIGQADVAMVHSATSDVHLKNTATSDGHSTSVLHQNLPNTLSGESAADSVGRKALGLTHGVADHQEDIDAGADGLPARAVLTTQVSYESTMSMTHTDHPPSTKPTEVLSQTSPPSDAGQPEGERSVIDKAYSAVGTTLLEQPLNLESNVRAMNESRPCTATIKTEVSFNQCSGPDSHFFADVRISVQSRGPTEENVVAVDPTIPLPLESKAAVAVLNTDAFTEKIDYPPQNSLIDTNVVTHHKEALPTSEDNVFIPEQSAAIPSTNSGLNDVSTEQNSSRMIASVTSGSLALRSSRAAGVPAEVLEATCPLPANSLQRPTDKSQNSTALTTTSTKSEKKLTLHASGPASGPHSTPANSADARLVLTESAQLTQSDKATKFETHTAIQMSVSHLESEELIDLKETSVQEVEDLTKPLAHPPKGQPSLPLPATNSNPNPLSPTPEGRMHTSPGVQPTSPVSITTSISTNLEVHVNRETGQIDFSFEVNGTPIPSAFGGGNVPAHDPSFSAEWNFKLERNAAFGPVGAIVSPSETPASTANGLMRMN